MGRGRDIERGRERVRDQSHKRPIRDTKTVSMGSSGGKVGTLYGMGTDFERC